jgi:hypothetical protein
LKTEDGSLRDTMADEEGMSDRSAASAGNSGILYVINGIFLVGERVGDKSTTLGIIWVVGWTKIKGKGLM